VRLLTCFLLLAQFFEATTAKGSSDLDYASFRAIFSSHLYELNAPVVVFNWYNARDVSSLPTSSNGPLGYKDFLNEVGLHWDKLNSDPAAGSIFGSGLYTALDPVITRSSFGGKNDRWVLTQAKLPANFRLIDLNADSKVRLNQAQRSLLARVGCPKEWSFLEDLFPAGDLVGHALCAALITKILRDDLKIDGFAFQNAVTPFSECPGKGAPRNVAIVITSAEKIPSENVRVYDRLTADSVQDRARIQSLFAKAALELAGQKNSSDLGIVNALSATTQAPLWDDVKPSPRDPALSTWIQQNLYGCGKSAPYHAIPAPTVTDSAKPLNEADVPEKEDDLGSSPAK
jgi:hypothetical protein